MGEKNLNTETNLTINLKQLIGVFVALIATIWTLYEFIVVSRIEQSEKFFDERIQQTEKHYKELLDVKFDGVNTSIQNLNNSVNSAINTSNANTQRFNDINNLQSNTQNAQGGGVGVNN